MMPFAQFFCVAKGKSLITLPWKLLYPRARLRSIPGRRKLKALGQAFYEHHVDARLVRQNANCRAFFNLQSAEVPAIAGSRP